MNSDAQLVAVLAGVVIPLLVGLLAKARAPSGLKAVLNAALTAAAAVLGSLPGDVTARELVISWGATWAISVATYYGLWKPTGVAGGVQSATAGVGVG